MDVVMKYLKDSQLALLTIRLREGENSYSYMNILKNLSVNKDENFKLVLEKISTYREPFIEEISE